MKSIVKENGLVYCNEGAVDAFHKVLKQLQPSKVFILTDTNTRNFCLQPFLKDFGNDLDPTILEIPAGEIHKTINTCLTVWEQLSEKGADRNSLLINLGGGVVTDLGGFVASTFKRGISFINIPTSLLAMVDASVGGKNGVDLGMIKNQIGVIRNPELVVIQTTFLNTLPKNEVLSGFAEMLKHGLIASEGYWNKLQAFDLNLASEAEDLIWESVLIKNNVVSTDPLEKGLRKTLNYGHTLGHAIESYCLASEEKITLLHGEAIAIGMVLATYFSTELLDFPKQKLTQITKTLIELYGKHDFLRKDINAIIDLLIYDKKNTNGKVLFVLLNDFGSHKINCEVPNTLIYKAFDYYKNF
ncbi:MAG: 3-dehydroquinate synthase [Flavobacteriales bacterium]|jgi:3-dehydroquinate synthase|nr:3-dehydroquinate synthase [Flavobacteriales bacterium]